MTSRPDQDSVSFPMQSPRLLLVGCDERGTQTRRHATQLPLFRVQKSILTGLDEVPVKAGLENVLGWTSRGGVSSCGLPSFPEPLD